MRLSRYVVVAIVCQLLLAFCVSAGAITPGHWKFDEGQGRTVKDALGNYPDAVIRGEPTWDDGKFGKALSLAEKNTFIIIERPKADTATAGAPPSFSVSVWVKVAKTQPDPYPGLVSTISQHDPRVHGFALNFRGKKLFFAVDSLEMLHSGKDMNDDLWHHVVGVYDGATRTPTLWIDGEKRTLKRKVDFIPSGKPLFINRYYGSPGGGALNGLIDELRIFDKALTDDEIRQLGQTTP